MGREPIKYDGVRVASDTTIEIDFYYAGQRCKERIKREPTPANLKKMSMFRSEILLAIERGDFQYEVSFPLSKKAKQFSKCPQAIGLTVGMYLETWLEAKKRQLAPSSFRDYSFTTKNILIPKLGHVMLKDLKWVDVKSMLTPMACSNGRLRNIQSCLRSALNTAVDDQVLESNILKDKVYSVQEEYDEGDENMEDRVDPFTAEEQAAILAASPAQFANLIKFAFWTGLRTSEMVALNWRDIDWEKKQVRVNKAWTRASTKPEDTKTPAGRRQVRLLSPALEALEAQKQYTYTKGEEIFQHPNTWLRWKSDKPIRDLFWVNVLPKAGVRYRNPYQTRHTYASMMLSAGEHPMWVAKQMGHASWTMIGKIYGRFMEEAVPDPGRKAEKMFAPKADRDVDHDVDRDVDQVPVHSSKFEE